MDLGAIRKYSLTVFLTAMIAYFSYHALNGEQGVFNWLIVRAEITEVEAELAMARAERRELEEIASRLRSDSLDLDYLEERARTRLDLAHPRDFVIETSPSENR